MSSLVNNGDLVPDGALMVSKQQTYESMLRVGISEHVARETTNANFKSSDCDSCPERINLYEMNTITKRSGQSSPRDRPHEHFRSTGIRDRAAPSTGHYGFGESRCLGERVGWTIGDNICLANL